MIRVLLVDDHTLFREGVRELLHTERDFQVVGHVANAGLAVEECVRAGPDIVLMDIGMPGLDAFEATRQIKRARPETAVLFLSMYNDEDHLRDALSSGASGYLLKDMPAPELVGALREVSRGGKYLDGRLVARFVNELRNPGKSIDRESRLDRLTPREREVLKLLAEGRSVKQIAGDLALSVKTVDAHKFNLMRKLDLHNRAELVQYAIQKKVIKLGNDYSHF